MRSSHRYRRVLIILGLLALLGGGILWIAHSSRAHIVEAGKVQVLVDKRYFGNKSSAGIGIGGRLTIIDGSCVTLSGSDGVPTTYLIWDHSTDVEGEDSDLEFHYAGHTARIGDYIEGGGEEAGDEVIIERFGSVPSACRGLTPLFLEELSSVTGDPHG